MLFSPFIVMHQHALRSADRPVKPPITLRSSGYDRANKLLLTSQAIELKATIQASFAPEHPPYEQSGRAGSGNLDRAISGVSA